MSYRIARTTHVASLTFMALVLTAPLAEAALSLDQLKGDRAIMGVKTGQLITVPGVRALKDVAYGQSAGERMDVYIPARARNAPILVMVHGGGWKRGDKAHRGTVENKGNYYLGKGFIFVSLNYPMLPDGADPVEQADYIAAAVAHVQKAASGWGGDSRQMILMGHSAGAHLVALVGADPSRVTARGGHRWAGTIPLDGAAMDVPGVMNREHYALHDEAFGTDPAFWVAASPLHQLKRTATPFLAVCSTTRDDSCPHNHDFVKRANALGVGASVLEQALNHGEINAQVGTPGELTKAIDRFIQSVLGRR